MSFYIVAPRPEPSAGDEVAQCRAKWDNPSHHSVAVLDLVHCRVQLALWADRAQLCYIQLTLNQNQQISAASY